MKRIFFIICFLVFAFVSSGQTADLAWGEEFKMRRSSADQMQVYADEDAVFFADRHDPFFPYFVYGPIKNETANLIKLDKNLAEQYKTDFHKELKGKEFEDFFFLGNKIFLFASFYNYKTLTVSLLFVEINKADGKLLGDWKEILSWKKYEDYKRFELKADYNADSSQIIIVAGMGNNKKNKYEVNVVDAEMKLLAHAAIENEFDPRIFELEQVVYTRKGNFLLLGRLGYKEAEKTSEKKIQFQHYSLRMYSSDGDIVRDIKLDNESMWVFSAKVAQAPGGNVVLAALYSSNKADHTVNGMLVEQIDPLTGEIKSSNNADIDPALLSTDEDIKNNFRRLIGKDYREKIREKRSLENGFLKFARFNNFIFTDDNRVLILAEKYKFYDYTVNKAGGIGLNASLYSNGYTVSVFELGDLIIAELTGDGTIAWITAVQKKQEEILHQPMVGFNTRLHLNLGNSYFDNNLNFPFFSGFSYAYSPGISKLSILFNDHPENGNSWEKDQKLKAVSSFEHSDCYLLQLDCPTQKFTSEKVFTNSDRPVAMLRSGYSYQGHFYFLGKTDRELARPLLQPGRISFK